MSTHKAKHMHTVLCFAAYDGIFQRASGDLLYKLVRDYKCNSAWYLLKLNTSFYIKTIN